MISHKRDESILSFPSKFRPEFLFSEAVLLRFYLSACLSISL